MNPYEEGGNTSDGAEHLTDPSPASKAFAVKLASFAYTSPSKGRSGKYRPGETSGHDGHGTSGRGSTPLVEVKEEIVEAGPSGAPRTGGNGNADGRRSTRSSGHVGLSDAPPSAGSETSSTPTRRQRKRVEVVITSPRKRRRARSASSFIPDRDSSDTEREEDSAGSESDIISDASGRPSGRRKRRKVGGIGTMAASGDGTVNGNTPKKEKSKGKTKPRPFAGPEVYSHLRRIPDHLKENLDIVFCGINPGKRSSTEGRHFAHPSNKFWKALYLSGITPRRVPPSEDELMPEQCNFGLTNLCDRPTMEQSELSTLEMRLRVPHLTRKLLEYRPLVVCFVGKKIWDVYEMVVSRTAGIPRPMGPEQGSTSSSSTGRRALNPYSEEDDGDARQRGSNDVPLNPYLPSWREHSRTVVIDEQAAGGVRMVSLNGTHTDAAPQSPNGAENRGAQTKKSQKTAAFDWHRPRPFRLPHRDGYTYFWVTPNTSGLERTPVDEVTAIFRSLHQFAQQLKDGVLVDQYFRDINVEGTEKTAEHMKEMAMARGQAV